MKPAFNGKNSLAYSTGKSGKSRHTAPRCPSEFGPISPPSMIARAAMKPDAPMRGARSMFVAAFQQEFRRRVRATQARGFSDPQPPRRAPPARRAAANLLLSSLAYRGAGGAKGGANPLRPPQGMNEFIIPAAGLTLASRFRVEC